MKRTEQITATRSAQMSELLRRLGASMTVRREQLALRYLVFMSFLLVQFALGVGINLFVSIPENHPGAGASNFVVGFFQSIVWGIAHGGLLVVAHVVLGVLLLLSAISPVVYSLRFGLRGAAIASGVGAVCVLLAAIDGPAFLPYHQDGYSLLMALGFGGAMLCYHDIALGLALLLFAAAVVGTAWVPRPIAFLTGLSGLTCLVQGWVVGTEGFSQTLSNAIVLTWVLSVAWMIWLVVVAWRMQGAEPRRLAYEVAGRPDAVHTSSG